MPPASTLPAAHGTRGGLGADGAAPRAAGGAASIVLGPVLTGRPRDGRVAAAFPAAVYLELAGADPPLIALVTSGAARLPNAMVLGPAGAGPLTGIVPGQRTKVGEGVVEAGPLRVRVARWWDPTPALGAVSRAALRRRLDGCSPLSSSRSSGLAGDPAVEVLGAACAEGALPRASGLARRLVGLGPGLTPSGDDVLAGLMLSLRLLGRALPGGERAVATADALAVAVTNDADVRTTPLAAVLLGCAARGQAAGEVAEVLRGLAGRAPLGPALDSLAAVGHTSGVDTAWGIVLGGRACLTLAGTTP